MFRTNNRNVARPIVKGLEREADLIEPLVLLEYCLDSRDLHSFAVHTVQIRSLLST